MNTSNSSQEENIFDVRQRTFSVTTAGDKKNVLRTGYIGPCVAFYGRHKDNKVVFMSHVDGNIFGYKNLEAKLKSLTNENLEGFSLYATTNYTISLRIFVILVSALIVFSSAEKFFSSLIFLVALGFMFGSLIQIYLFSILRFKKSQFRLQRRCQPHGRITVSIDAASEDDPSPNKEPIEPEESKKLYGPESGHCWLSGQKEITPKAPECGLV